MKSDNDVGRICYAHTLPDAPRDAWQRLEDHLEAVGGRAAEFSDMFGAADWGRLAGRLHDLGKCSAAFQDYLSAANGPDSHASEQRGMVDHSTAGAQFVVDQLPVLGHLLAYVIAGHHSGLLDGRGEGACLDARLRKVVEPWLDAAGTLTDVRSPSLPRCLEDALAKGDPFRVAMFVRMLFSCLIDADRLDTELFAESGTSDMRPEWPADTLERLEVLLGAYIDGLPNDETAVGRVRREVRDACLRAAEREPGIFSLTVPTGGGKTLSSLAFALRHAVAHGLGRIIYVAPFTTIIEQNAGVFRDALEPFLSETGLDPVLEHHSNVDRSDPDDDLGTLVSELAAENWDAPVIVTTSVQFYESLFANRTSRCRKVHRMARSVIILDEVQTLPVGYLHPCLSALSELAMGYGASIVLCTATQPAIHVRKDFPIGIEGVREIIENPPDLYRALKRVEIEEIGPLVDDALASQLLEEERVLCIVNTRRHAREIFSRIGDSPDHFHLSAQMCPEHRIEVLKSIHQRLDAGVPCRVVSTQLIEAGVDIDFPVVYRSLAGLDSIAQAAGRCNRNGKLPGLGRTLVFRSEHMRSERFFSDTTNCTAQVLPLHSDPLSLEAIEHYFRLYYWDQSSRWDARHVMRETRLTGTDHDLPFNFGFASIGEKFRLIEDHGDPVIVPWETRGIALCEELRGSWSGPSRNLLRRLQRFTVQMPRRTWERHVQLGSIQLVHERYPVLVNTEIHYSRRTGVTLDDELDPLLVT